MAVWRWTLNKSTPASHWHFLRQHNQTSWCDSPIHADTPRGATLPCQTGRGVSYCRRNFGVIVVTVCKGWGCRNKPPSIMSSSIPQGSSITCHLVLGCQKRQHLSIPIILLPPTRLGPHVRTVTGVPWQGSTMTPKAQMRVTPTVFRGRRGGGVWWCPRGNDNDSKGRSDSGGRLACCQRAAWKRKGTRLRASLLGPDICHWLHSTRNVSLWTCLFLASRSDQTCEVRHKVMATPQIQLEFCSFFLLGEHWLRNKGSYQRRSRTRLQHNQFVV